MHGTPPNCYSSLQRIKGTWERVPDCSKEDRVRISFDMLVVDALERTRSRLQSIVKWSITYTTETMDAVTRLCSEAPFPSINSEVDAQPIVKTRTEELFTKVASCANTPPLCDAFSQAKEAKSTMKAVMDRLHDDVTADMTSAAGKIHEELLALFKVCNTVTAMVALWRTLKPFETRTHLCERVSEALKNEWLPEGLKHLLDKAAQGRGTFEVE